jgi:TorA maturation chaperone TorD
MNQEAVDTGTKVDLFLAFFVGFRFLSHVYLKIPEQDFIAELIHKNLLFQWPIEEKNEDLSMGLKLLQNFSSGWKSSQIVDIKSDYTRLFIGLESTLAPPYASVYLSKDHLLFEKQTLEAREHYEKFSLSVDRKFREPDDHIGNELDFLAFLCRKAAQSLESQKTREASDYQDALKEFLSAHLLLWLSPFIARIKKNAGSLYYRGIACLTEGTVSILSQKI